MAAWRHIGAYLAVSPYPHWLSKGVKLSGSASGHIGAAPAVSPWMHWLSTGSKLSEQNDHLEHQSRNLRKNNSIKYC